MNADCARGTSGFTRSGFHSVTDGIDWKTTLTIFMVVLLCSVVGAVGHFLLVPGEARHAGIVHDMWAARQYLIPRINGLPVLDGAPLHYWLSLGFMSLFGPSEWGVRLLSVISAALTLGFLARVWLPWMPPRSTVTLAILFLVQPALVAASRFASPDMLNILLLAMSVGSFQQAVFRLEQKERASAWGVGGWVAAALLGLGAGPLAVVVPLIILFLWLTLRRKFDLMRAVCWWPGPLAAVALVLPWLCIADVQYPGLVAAITEKQLLSLFGQGRNGWVEAGYAFYGLLMLGGLLPLVACLYRYRDPMRMRASCTPAAGLMAVWLAVLIPLHPLVAMSAVGPAALLTVPLIYFGVLALAPVQTGRVRADICAWLLHCVLLAAVGVTGAYLAVQRVSHLPPLTAAIAQHYHAATDKVIMLDRFDYEFNFYMRSSKLVYVVTDWTAAVGAATPSWETELSESARFAPETAERLLLGYGDFLDKLCERRVVNLWVIGSRHAPERHPILRDLSALVGPNGVRAWYLDASTPLGRCGPAHSS